MNKLERPADNMMRKVLLGYIGKVEPSTVKDLTQYYLSLKMITSHTEKIVLTELDNPGKNNECSKM